MTGYAWAVSAGGTITAGGTAVDNTATVSWNVAGPQTVSVNYAAPNTCTAATPTIFNVTVFPLVLPTITGPITLNVGSTGTYTTQSGMTNYSWTVSGSGCTITGGQGTPAVTISFSGTGNKTIRLTYTNAYGCDPVNPASLNIKIVKPKDLAAEGSMHGNVNNDNNLNPTFEIYPSPNQGQFTAAINSTVDDLYTIQVYNSVGVRLYEIQNVRVNGNNETKIDIRPAPAGLYIVVFMNNQSQTVRKFFVSM